MRRTPIVSRRHLAYAMLAITVLVLGAGPALAQSAPPRSTELPKPSAPVRAGASKSINTAPMSLICCAPTVEVTTAPMSLICCASAVEITTGPMVLISE